MSNEMFAHSYKKYTTTLMLEADIKNIKKLNNILFKFYKTEKLNYIFEATNIIKSLSNYIDIKEAREHILEYIEEEYKYIIEVMIVNVNHVDIELLRKYNVIPS